MHESPTRLLLIEDNPEDARLIAAFLRDSEAYKPYHLTLASHLDEALRLLDSQSFDVILLDLTLPDADGLAAVSRLGARILATPLIVITEFADAPTALEAVRLGAQDHLVKHFLTAETVSRSIRYAIERARIRHELLERESQYRLLAENITDVIVRHAPDSTICYVSPSCRMLLGYEPDEMVGHKTDEFFHPDDLHILNSVREQSRRTLNSYTITYRIRHKNATYVWFETTGNVTRDPATKVVLETISVSRDITARHNAEEMTRLLQKAVEQTTDAVIVMTAEPDLSESRIVFVNSAFSRLTGYAPEDLIGRQRTILQDHLSDPKVSRQMHEALARDGSFRGESLNHRKNGQEYVAEWNIAPIHGASGAITHYVCAQRDVTERRRKERALRESEIRFKAIAEALPVAVAITRLRGGTILYANDLYCDVIGVPRGAAVGAQARDFYINPEDRDRFVHDVSQNGLLSGRELQITRADGSLRWILVSSSTITFEGEAAILSGIQDITRIKELEHERALLVAIVESSEDAIVGKSLDGVILSWNQGAQHMYGYTPDEAIGQSVQMLTPPERASEISALLAQIRHGEHVAQYETVRLTKAGRRIDISLAMSPIQSPDGTIVGAASIARDITARKEADRVLREFSQRIAILHSIDRGILNAQSPSQIASMIARSLTDLIHCDAVRIIAVDSRDNPVPYLADYPPVSQVSQDLLRQAIASYGLPESFRQGQALLIDDVQTYDDFWAGFEEVLTRYKARSWIIVPLIAAEQLVGALAAGSLRPYAFTSEHFEIAGEVADQLAIALHKNHLDDQIREHAHDLEARVAERTEQLRAAKERIETILMSASDAIIVVTSDGNVEQINPAFTALFGLTLDHVHSMALSSLVDSDSLPALREIFADLSTYSRPNRLELVCVRGNGTVFDAEVAFAPVPGEQVVSIVCSIRNITPQKQAEENLRQALTKERELGELKMRFVSMVSHEFRTPLSSILTSSDLMKFYADRMTSEKKLEHLERIQIQVRHLTDLLEDVLFMSRAETTGVQVNLTLTDFEAFCRSLVEEMQLTASAHTLRFSSTAPALMMQVDPKLMRQVVANLLSNAVKYSPAGSLIQIDLVRQASTACLRVTDAGIGIPDEDQTHLFELFHRAGNVGTTPGTGLGLSIIRHAVEAHRGTVVVESQVGVGTTFTIALPIT